MMLYLLLVVTCSTTSTKNFTLKCTPKTESFHTTMEACDQARVSVPSSQCITVKVN